MNWLRRKRRFRKEALSAEIRQESFVRFEGFSQLRDSTKPAHTPGHAYIKVSFITKFKEALKVHEAFLSKTFEGGIIRLRTVQTILSPRDTDPLPSPAQSSRQFFQCRRILDRWRHRRRFPVGDLADAGTQYLAGPGLRQPGHHPRIAK